MASLVGAFSNQKLRGSTVPGKVLRWNEIPGAWTSAPAVAQSTNTFIGSDTGNKSKVVIPNYCCFGDQLYPELISNLTPSAQERQASIINKQDGRRG